MRTQLIFSEMPLLTSVLNLITSPSRKSPPAPMSDGGKKKAASARNTSSAAAKGGDGGKKGRGVKFDDNEVQSLLDLIEEHQPFSGGEWDLIAGLHDRLFPDRNHDGKCL